MATTDLATTAEALVAPGKGILAADESTGTIARRFESIGVESTEAHRGAYRELLFTAAGIEAWISGVILFDETIHQSAADGTPFPRLLEERGIIAGIKVDTGTKPLALAPGETITEGLDGLRERLSRVPRARRALYQVARGARNRGSPAERVRDLDERPRAGPLRRAVAGSRARSDRRARGADGRRPRHRDELRSHVAHAGRRLHESSATSASASRGFCSSRTWCWPATPAGSSRPTSGSRR